MSKSSQAAQYGEASWNKRSHKPSHATWRKVDEGRRRDKVSDSAEDVRQSSAQQEHIEESKQSNALGGSILPTMVLLSPAEVFGGTLQLKSTFLHFEVPPDVHPMKRSHSEPNLDGTSGRLLGSSPTDRQESALPLCLYKAESSNAVGICDGHLAEIGSRREHPVRHHRSHSGSACSSSSSHSSRGDDQSAKQEAEQRSDNPQDIEWRAEVLARARTDASSGAGNYVWKLARHNEETSRLLQRTVSDVAGQLEGAQQKGDVARARAHTDAKTILDGFKGHVAQAAMHQQANYVLQRVIEEFPYEHIVPLVEELVGKALQVTKHRIGCRIMLRIFRHRVNRGPFQELAEEILPEAGELARHVHANYVIQEILRCGHPDYQHRAARALRQGKGGLVQTTKSKHGSLCVEVALQHCSEEDVEALAQELLDNEKASSMADNSFGGHVLKTLMRSGKLSPNRFSDTVSLLPKAKQKRLMKLLNRPA